jgi:8-oxo-dGTP diphosphatase
MNVRPAILIIVNDKILTLEYQYGSQAVYNLPGGNVEFGETMSQTLQREMMEELGIKVSVGELTMVGEVHLPDKNKYTLHCLFEGTITEGNPEINLQNTSAKAIKWLYINELANIHLYPNFKKEIPLWLNDQLEDYYIGKIEQEWV